MVLKTTKGVITIKSLLTKVAASVLVSFSAAAVDKTTTKTTTWIDEYGRVLHEHSKTKRVESFKDPKFDVRVGVAVPAAVTLHPLPETITVEDPDRYSYVIINDDSVVVEKTTRKVIHAWDLG